MKEYQIDPATSNAHACEDDHREIADEDYCTLLADDGTLQENIKVPAVPTDLGKRIKASFEADKHLVVSVMSAMKQERIIAVQEVRDSN